MSRLARLTAGMLAAAAPAWAAGTGDTGGGGILVFLFLGFGALIIVFQAVPGFLMLFSMLRGLFSRETSADAVKER